MKNDVFLVDTSVWLEVLRSGRDGLALKERVSTLIAEDSVATTGIVLLELLGGTRTEVEYERLKNMLSALHPLPVDDVFWEKASRLAFATRRRGLTVPFTDVLIAIVAMESGAVLVHQHRHFDVLASHAPLRVESHV